MNVENTIIKVRIEDLVPNKYQPRKYFDDVSLNELASSIKTYGIINPILVRKKDDKYEIIAGERRMRAAKLCGLTEVPVIVKNADEQQSAEYALIENLQRKDLTAIESAKAYEEIIKLGNSTQNDLAQKIGKSQSYIANKIRLLSLPPEIQEAVIQKKISERHARSILRITDKEQQLKILERIINEKLSVKETEDIIDMQYADDIDISTEINNILEMLTEKEEKEDDNMNNGNFFPTYDNNVMPQANNTSLNNLNGVAMMNPSPQENIVPPMNPQINQVIEQPPMMNIPPVEQPVQPQFGVSEPMQMNEQIVPPTNFIEQPQMTAPEIMPTMNTTFYNPPTPPEPTETTIPMVDTPLFAPESINLMQMNTQEQPLINQEPSPVPFGVPEPMQMNEQIVPPTNFVEQPQMIEPQNNLIQNDYNEIPDMQVPELTIPANDNLFEVPVNNIPEMNQQVISNPVNQIDELTSFLAEKGINYKQYSNETGHCIIIEM